MRVNILYKHYIILLALLFLELCSSAKILVLYPSPSQSHLIVTKALTRELASRGHEVTVFSQFPLDKPMKNYRDVKVDLDDGFTEMTATAMNKSMSIWTMLKSMPSMVSSITAGGEATLNHPEMKRMMQEESFDLVIVGFFMVNYLLGVGVHFKCPTVIISPAGAFTAANIIMGNPLEISSVPHISSKHDKTMSFPQRVFNFIMYSTNMFFASLLDYHQSTIYNKYFPSEKYISYNEALKNVSLMLLNQHFTQDHVKPYVPAMIEVGGLQVKTKPSLLPKDIQDWMDDAEHGVIFFSLGSNAKSSLLPKEKIEIFMRTFARLKQRVIFKWESDDLPGKPDNVLIGKWLPQDDILAHSNTKIFISHCGLGSVVETKYHGVPVVGVPVFPDQMSNAASIEKEGWGIVVSLDLMTDQMLYEAIEDVLNDSRYKNRVQYLSKLYKDRPMSAMETAVFWIEYVIRHRGAAHMHYPGADLNFLERNSLDVLSFLIVILYVILKTLKCCIKFSVKFLRC